MWNRLFDMEINRNNYEAYLLDLVEGKLSAEELRKVREFLVFNPDCGELLNDTEPWLLKTEAVSFRGKELLKKHLPETNEMITDRNFDLFSIARLEGDLTPEQESAHETMVAENDLRQEEWTAWQNTRLPVGPVLYPGKQGLLRRKKGNSRILWLSLVSAAAVIALLFFIFKPVPDLPLPALTDLPAPGPAVESAVIDGKGPSHMKGIVPLKLVERDPGNNGSVMFAARKHTRSPAETSLSAGNHHPVQHTGLAGEVKRNDYTLKQVRITELLKQPVIGINTIEPDRIRPLEVPPSAIHYTSLSIAQIASMNLPEVIDEVAEEKNISLWSVASAGIKGINKVTGADISLLAYRDDDGGLSGIRLKSKRFSVNTPVTHKE